ncbi:MAG: nucleotidyltransferase [Bacillota bacterium]
MKITGIITEYNPFHYGHLYHLQKSKKITNSNAVICIMNGNFTQRGVPAITNKWTRTKMALLAGVDLVIELPLVFGIRSANYFANGAVKLLDQSNIVDYLVFGSEAGNIKILKDIAKFLNKNDKNYQQIIKKEIKKGYSYPKARENALKNFFHEKKYINQIKNPNNILAIEYLRSILKNNSSIKALTIKRSDNNYHSTSINGKFASGTAIRKAIRNDNLDELKQTIPPSSYQLIINEIKENKIPVKKEKLSYPLLTKLRKINSNYLKKFAEINNGLEYRFINSAYKSGNYKELVQNIKTKSLTQNRIQRNLLHILFDIREKDFNKIDKNGPAYLRVLGTNKKGKKLLSQLKNEAEIPLITKISRYINDVDIHSDNSIIKQLSYEILADDIYSLLYNKAKFRKARQDFYQKLIIKEEI